jgi:aminoglycoside 2''-adenylyltransferase
MNSVQLPLIFELFDAAENLGLPLWLESGWAIDARLGRITREHEDVDLAFPLERLEEFTSLLQLFDCGVFEKTDYGFLVYARGVLLDCEACVKQPNGYELEGVPAGSCPWEKQGSIAGVAVRCTSWDAILWEYLYYLDEVPQSDWREKDFGSYETVCRVLGQAAVERLQATFAAGKHN